MNTYLVKINVKYKSTVHSTQHLVMATDENDARVEALYVENHTYSRSDIKKAQLKGEYSQLAEGDFSYEIVSVVEMQSIELDTVDSKPILVPKDTSLIDTVDDICPVTGSFSIQMVTFGWIVDGVHKEIKRTLGSSEGVYHAIAYAVSNICGDLTEEQMDSTINCRGVVEGVKGEGLYFIKDTVEMESIQFSIGLNDIYFSWIPSCDTESKPQTVALWDVGM